MYIYLYFINSEVDKRLLIHNNIIYIPALIVVIV